MISSKTNIEKYIAGKMSRTERAIFEKEMSSDPFLKDAVDGYQIFPKQIHAVPQFKAGNGVAWVIGIATVSIALLFSFWPEGDSHYDEIAEPIDNRTMMIPAKTEAPNDLQSIELITSIELNREVKPEPILTQRNVEVLSNRTELTATTLPRIEVKEISFQRVGQIRSNIRVVYLHNLKLALAPSFEIDIKDPIAVGQGLPASQEKVYRSPSKLFKKYQNLENDELTYLERMEPVLKDVESGRYVAGLTQISQLDHENDVNILFYSGLCHFHMAEYETSIELFERSRDHLVQSFYEEATWYLAASLLKVGRQEEAIDLYNEILLRNGHYSPMAASRLARLTP